MGGETVTANERISRAMRYVGDGGGLDTNVAAPLPPVLAHLDEIEKRLITIRRELTAHRDRIGELHSKLHGPRPMRDGSKPSNNATPQLPALPNLSAICDAIFEEVQQLGEAIRSL